LEQDTFDLQIEEIRRLLTIYRDANSVQVRHNLKQQIQAELCLLTALNPTAATVVCQYVWQNSIPQIEAYAPIEVIPEPEPQPSLGRRVLQLLGFA
jgi:hypothetical protein